MREKAYRKNVILTLCTIFLLGYLFVLLNHQACANYLPDLCVPSTTPSPLFSISPSLSPIPSTSPVMSFTPSVSAGMSATPTVATATDTPIPQTQITTAAHADNVPTSPPDTGHAQ